MKNTFVALGAAILISGCGGGSSNNSGGSSPSNDSALTGNWTYASGGHTSGGACGLDIHGGYEKRIKVSFSGSAYHAAREDCYIPSGNTGVFVATDSVDGTYQTGSSFMTWGGRTYNKLNLSLTNSSGQKETVYTAYNVSANELRVTTSSGANDGSTEDKRQTGIAIDQEVYIKQ